MPGADSGAIALWTQPRQSLVCYGTISLSGSQLLALKQLCEREPKGLRLSSLARVAHDFGERATSVGALKQQLAQIHQTGIDAQEPFLAPLERVEAIPSENDVTRWLIAGILEQLELREWYS